MQSRDLLRYAYDQIAETFRGTVEGLGADDLARQVAPDANPIGWLAWHLLRVQDDHVADVAGTEQVWTADGWAGRFGLPVDDAATGYGMSSAEVAAVRVPSADLLLGYAEAVSARTAEFLSGLSDDDLDRVVDTRWDPPVTLGVRLVSVLSDDLQHLGQAAYLRGLLGA
ncbi:mycothiol transferase [Geodermatophilus sp. CPCC 206100]|uniref:mycothiol transferase n=1 Tax=Geodermatophilus sp. CPCC 206100 TaxID=3020054 RepID=UPI003B008E05